VAGAAAVLLQANPGLTPALVKAMLQYTAEPLPTASLLEQGTGQVNLEGAVRQNPEDANTANYLGYLYADRGESLDRADSLISSALRTDPDNTAFLDSRAWLRFHQGRQVEALKDIESALASGESDLTIRVHKARILEALGRKTDARTIWVAIAKIDPAHPEAKAGLERTK
jgi:Flp pilus assembly protein TadD